ncbi:alpha/beta hydrolase [Chryseolinea sp. T2]|uniref:alpha/beta fold hydrolase n=1 Tax=Chryseolinea sp. T2 TaxID=3129255 RepID=UPI003076A7B9
MKKLIIKSLGVWLNVLAVLDPERAAKAAFQIFGHPRRQPVTRKHLAFFKTADQSSMEFQGLRIQVYRWGNGDRSILFLHGWESHTYRWKRYIETFRDAGYTVFAFDAPAHGQSEGNSTTVPLYADTLKAFVEQYGQPDAIVGHSMGTFASFYGLYKYPEITPRTLITLAAPGEATEFIDHYQRTLSLTARTREILVQHFTKLFQAPPEFFSTPFFAASLTIPGLLIHDEEDNETSVKHSQRIHAAWKGSELIVTKGLGHNLKSPGVVDQVFRFANSQLHEQAAGN